MRFRTYLFALLGLSVLNAQAATFPVKDAKSAIAIARDVCRHEAKPSLPWEATLSNTGDIWFADTMPSIRLGGKHLWSVDVPVNGPYPINCSDDLYEFVDFGKPWTPDAESISLLESAVKIPADDGRAAIPINRYARYYDGSIVRSGHHTVYGEFVFPQDQDDKPAGVYIWTGRGNYPRSMAIDGGCNIVHVYFDVEAKRITSIACNQTG